MKRTAEDSRWATWRRRAIGVTGVLLAVGLVLAPAGASAQRRVALVIGNAAYVEPDARLTNPVNDARDVAQALGALDFDEVLLREDLDREEMEQAVDDFIGTLRAGDVAVFYYAGHGLELDDGENYLAPVDFSSSYTPVRARNRALQANEVQALMEEAGARTRIVILDACRNNPFERVRSLTRGGLGQMTPRGGLVAYATEAGDTAADNGLYAQHLVAALRVPGLPAMELFTRVSEAVEAASDGAQVPIQQFGSTVGRFVFHPGDVVDPVARLATNRLAALGGGASAPPVVEDARPPARERPATRDAALARYIGLPITRGLGRIGRDTLGRVFGNLPAPVGNAYFAPSVTLTELSGAAGSGSYRIVCPRGERDGNEVTLYSCLLGQPAGGAGRPAGAQRASRDRLLARYIGLPITRGLGRIGRDTLGRVFGNLPAPVGNAYFAPSVTLTELSGAAGSGSYRIVCPRGERDGNEVTLYSCLLGQPAGGAGRPAGAQRASRDRLLARYIGLPITRGLGRIGRDTLGRVFGNLPAPVGNAYFAPSVTLTELSGAAGSGSYRIVCPHGERDGNEVTLYGCELR